MPAFLKYDQTVTAKFPVTAKKSVGLYNQNALLTTYPGAIGGKIGWTSAAGATYVGMARRNGVTLIVTLLHCPALTEIDSGKSLLNWGFAVDGKLRPVGTLVGARQPPASASARRPPASASARRPPASASARRPAADLRPAARPHSVAAGPSALTAAGFSGAALVAVGVGFAYSRRQRPAARRARFRPRA